ncbi:hypothetical protein [Cereibacter changlensis]|uniref:hypothetical protein n=1 Tax=Cereibacter changlensis TaxID=402884 RepID=UPI004033EC8A
MMKFTIPDNLRQIAFGVCQIVSMLYGSTYYLLANDPAEFAKFGAVIIVLALLFLTVSRVRHEDAMKSWNEARLFSLSNHHERLTGISDKTLRATFELTLLEMSRIARKANVSTQFLPFPEERERQMEEKLNADMGPQSDWDNQYPALYSMFDKEQLEYDHTKAEISGWVRFIWRLEVVFIAMGTLQNAYGADFVTWFHASFLPWFHAG